MSHLRHLEGKQPYLGDLLTMVINHLLTGMILQVVTGTFDDQIATLPWANMVSAGQTFWILIKHVNGTDFKLDIFIPLETVYIYIHGNISNTLPKLT